MNKDITNPGNKAISYAATLSSVVSLLPVRKPGTPSFWREGTPSFRAVGNHAGLFWVSIYRFSVSNGAPPAVPA